MPSDVHERIIVEEYKVRYDYWNGVDVLKFKVSFWGRLKFLFKGYNAEFEVPKGLVVE